MSNTQSSDNYYEQDSFQSIERAILAESITFSTLSNVEGKFNIPVMMPSVDTSGSARTQVNGKYQSSNFVYLNIPAYILLQFMMPSLHTIGNELNKSSLHDIVTGATVKGSNSASILVFDKSSFTIPKGTEFLIEFIGGYMSIDKICIIGVNINKM